MELKFLGCSHHEIWSDVGHTEELVEEKPEKPCKLFSTHRCF